MVFSCLSESVRVFGTLVHRFVKYSDFQNIFNTFQIFIQLKYIEAQSFPKRGYFKTQVCVFFYKYILLFSSHKHVFLQFKASDQK